MVLRHLSFSSVFSLCFFSPCFRSVLVCATVNSMRRTRRNPGHWSFRPMTISAYRPITCMSQNYDLVIELCDQIAKFYFHTSCYTQQINFLQYMAHRIFFAVWVMYCLGHSLWRQDKLWLIISKYSYIKELNLAYTAINEHTNTHKRLISRI